MDYDNNMIHLRAQRGDICFGPDRIKLYAYTRTGKNRAAAASELALSEMAIGMVMPSFALVEKNEAQQLMDDLWDCGLRPSEGTGSAGAMAATQKHLVDMKTIAFHALKIAEKK